MNEDQGIPNLDCMTQTERKAVGRVFYDLSLYCSLRNRAERYRLDGRIDLARQVEGLCDEIYRKLPAWARW